MRYEVAMKWADDLESGEYAQTQGCLERVNSHTGETEGYCCLGVLMRGQAVAAGVVKREYEEPKIYTETWHDETEEYLSPANVSYDGVNGILTDKVKDWAGFKNANPIFKIEGMTEDESSAAQLNDAKGYTFPMLAKLVREQWETL